ncbi:sensor domain-containing diguanylate cyclase [Acinetobacter radioresistens]|uniref:sensor domain-containing diguanylate cyclase n=1 Tax=Acinetobacter radioresistens TaxID=40216 RepID=UPI002245FEDC|nr:sensor domain-containing diguanylate cyclase [Acinetobacter radioresistens]MCX0334926.1 sensor domain-containing diguanylate cyclase [Acinetobacter radioresistens]
MPNTYQRKIFKLNLRKLILILTALAVSFLFVISLVASYILFKKELVKKSLFLNYEYASKIASNTDRKLQVTLNELKYSADIIGQGFDQRTFKEHEVERLKNLSHHFDTLIIGNSQGSVTEYTLKQLNLDQRQVSTSLGVQGSLRSKHAYISPPYYSVRNNLVIFISQPIFDNKHIYKGYVGTLIHLKETNMINELLPLEYNYKNNNIYIIDRNGKIVFDPNRKKIGGLVAQNSSMASIEYRKSGKTELINDIGTKYVAGFAYIPTTGWIVVSQEPLADLIDETKSIIFRLSGVIFIFYLLIFYIVWRASAFISSPLHELAKMASALNQPETKTKIKKIKPWYYEVQKFKFSLLSSIEKFSSKIDEMNFHINSDPLTQLFNRRGMEIFVKEMIDSDIHFSILLIDIDRFKRVNDTYGHDIGDEVLKILAKLIQENFRKEDLCCRYGGEEFIVVIPNNNKQEIYESAERFRRIVEAFEINNVGRITISIGIASWPDSAEEFTQVLKIADNNLYYAKNNGRNQIKYS